MELVLCTFYTIVFIYLIYKLSFFKIDGISRRLLSGLFIIKIFSAIAITFIYTYYYKDHFESDIYKYFFDGHILFRALTKNPLDYLSMLTGIGSDAPHLEPYYNTMNFWKKSIDYGLFNDNRTMIRFNAFSMLFSFGYMNVHNVFMAFLSFTGLTAVFRTFYPFFLNKKYALIFSVYLIPSVLLWTSGILKEGILIFAFGLLIYYVYKITNRTFKWKTIIYILIMTGILLVVKFYVLLAALPGLLCIIAMNKIKKIPSFYILITIHTAIITSFFLFHVVFKEYNLPEIISNKQHDFINMVGQDKNVGSRIDIPVLEPSFTSFLFNTPAALTNSFFRPHIFEVHSMMAIPSAAENLFIIMIMLLTIIFFKKYSLETFPWFWFCVSFVLILFTLCGLTTPVLGALVRYRTPALPFLFIIFLTFIDLNKIQQLIKWKK